MKELNLCENAATVWLLHNGIGRWVCFGPVTDDLGGRALEELYPGKGNGHGFHVTGFATVSQSSRPILSGTNRSLIAGLRNFGRENLFVHQSDSDPNPSFDFRPLTDAFLYNAIYLDRSFAFSITSPRIGDVTYVSGASARDYGGEVAQGMISLQATGYWNRDGLTLEMSGELGDKEASLGRPVEVGFQHASYAVNLNIPWLALRFIFYREMGFIIENYQKYGKDG
ncbi:MAG: hypothetical protein AAB403_02725 [Planctomycetota bacterium]